MPTLTHSTTSCSRHLAAGRPRKRCRSAVLLSALLACCTPVPYAGAEPPWFLMPLPAEPAVDAEGRLQRQPFALDSGEAESDSKTAKVPLSLALQATAYAHPRMQAALELVAQARADHITARLLPNPSFSAAISLLPLPGKSFNEATRQGGPPQLDLGIGMMLDELVFGKRELGASVAALEVDAVLAEYAEVARNLLLETTIAFHEALLAGAMMGLAKQFVEQLTAMEELTAQRVALGGVARNGLDRMRLELAAQRRELLRAEAAHEAALARFRLALGRAEGAERAVPVGELEAVPEFELPGLVALMQLAAEHRPDLAEARRDVLRTKAAVRREQRMAWPQFGVLGGYTRQFQRRAIGFPDASSFGGGLDLTLPMFDRNQGNIARALSEARAAELVTESIELELRAEVAQAMAALRLARQLEQAIGEAELGIAVRLRESAEMAYRSGGQSLLEVLDAGAAYRELRRDHLVAHAELWLALHRLDAAVGTTSWRAVLTKNQSPEADMDTAPSQS